MEFILSVEEMRRADAVAIEKLKIPGIILMENAGLKTAQYIAERFAPLSRKKVGIFCGKGNNGGDGFVVGRHLHQMSAKVNFWLVGKKEDLHGDALINMRIADQMGLTIREIETWQSEVTSCGYDLLIDALLGTGLKGEVRGIYAEIIKSINQFPGNVAAVDTPSGLNCDSGKPLGDCVCADITVTMGNIKTGMLFYPGREYTGELAIADLSVPASVFRQIHSQKQLYSIDNYIALLPSRSADAYKNTFGKVLVLAGSTGLTGAASLCSQAALRSGAGMVILGCPDKLNSIFEEKLTEVMTDPLPCTDNGCLQASAFDAVAGSLAWSHVIALGPGLSTHPETRKFVHRVLREQSRPMVIDADGLNNLAEAAELLAEYKGELALTPHVGELSRLTGLKIAEIQESPVEIVKKYAQKWDAVLLLKGAPTIIGDREGNIYFNPSGNSGLATAGSGDVLTGLITGFLAQGLKAKNAALLGAFVHGLSGDHTAMAKGQRGLIAGDLLNHIPDVLVDLEARNYESIANYFLEYHLRLF